MVPSRLAPSYSGGQRQRGQCGKVKDERSLWMFETLVKISFTENLVSFLRSCHRVFQRRYMCAYECKRNYRQPQPEWIGFLPFRMAALFRCVKQAVRMDTTLALMRSFLCLGTRIISHPKDMKIVDKLISTKKAFLFASRPTNRKISTYVLYTI